MRARTWVSRALVVIAVFASLATSARRWEVAADWPKDAPYGTPHNGKQGVMFTVEASHAPDIYCDFGSTYVPRSSRLAPETRAGSAAEYFCPPGGGVRRVTIDGRFEGGCGKKQTGPPADAFVRVTKAELVDAWEATGEARFTMRTDKGGNGHVPIVVRSPQRAHLQVWLEGPDAPLFSGLDAYEAQANHFTIVAYARRNNEPAPDATVEVVVRAYVFGYCRPSCGPPADPIIVERE